MAESIYSVVVEKVLEKLGSFVYQEISSVWGVRNDLKKLQETLTSVKAVLLDAEEKQVQSHQLRDWLQKVTDACYDTEDVLDEFEIEVLRRQVLKQQSIGRKVRNFVSSSNPLAFRFRMSHKMKEIRDKFDEIAAIKAKFHLTERDDNRLVVNRGREVTHSFVRASDVIGRDKDKEEIIKLVLSPSDGHENVSVIPIVGIGGLGKTTLAKLVYNDQRVDQRFELKIWVCVSDEFFIKKLMVDMIESATCQNHSNMNIDQLQRILRDTLRDKQYLIVMDDVWNEDSELWIELKNLLLECGSGSKIIVTTRSDRVASIVGTVPTYNLGGLSLEESLSLLVKCAFREGEGKQLPNLIKIAEEIVKKCGGVPLAVRALGSLLYSSTYERDWENVRDNEIWKLEQKDNGILHALRISYNHLPSFLKQCFIYCSIYPKDYLFVGIELVQFWMAHGLLQSPDENQDLENIGMQYLKELISRSFFQDIIQSCYDFPRNFKMHDLMHDLATSLMRTECLIVKSSNQFCSKTVRHLSFDVDDTSKIDVPNFLSDLGHLRSICFPIISIGPSQSFLEILISRFQFLRVLDLLSSDIEMVPKKIGNLKHLRYLDLSRNPKIKELPNSIYKLQCLQTLLINGCDGLRVLPRDVKYLINLRHLTLTTTQKCLPKNEIGCLNSLRRLEIYDCHNLEYLFEDIGCLGFLRMLFIEKCPRLISLPCSMKNLSSLECLDLADCERLNLNLSMELESQDNHKDLSIPRLYLRYFTISNVSEVVEFPQWLIQGSANTLQTLHIANCSNLKELPESMRKLQVLYIFGCPELSSLPKGMNSLTALRELKIKDCPKLSERCKPETGEDWSKIAHTPEIEVDGEIIKPIKN